MYNLTDFERLTLELENRNFYLAVVVAIITFISVLLIYLDYRNRKNKERAEKSILIAEEFANNIVAPISIIYKKFEQLGIDSLVNNKVNFMRFIDFDIDELHSLYDAETIEKYKEIINTEDELRFLICQTLNKLEYMCMNISTKVADEKYIYNSLHQQFLKCIALLYFEISLTNTDFKDKYFTNIIQVYNIWKNKYIKVEEKEKRIKKKLKPKIHKIN